jgi:putative lipoic acid-binding regulatory protein
VSHSEADSLIEYPCDFPIKVMGAASADFPAIVCRMVRAHAPDFDAASIQTRASTSGRVCLGHLHGTGSLPRPTRRPLPRPQ